jgi:two-component system, NtrC family, sensor kinase
MRLTLKLVLAFMLANIALAVAYGFLAVRRDVWLFEHRAAAEAEEIGLVIERPLVEVWRKEGLRGMNKSLKSIAGSAQQPLRIRWVWFDPGAEAEFSPAVSAGDITEIVLNEHRAVESPEPDGITYIHIYWPMVLTADRRGGLEFAHPMTELQDEERDIIERVALLVGGMVLISGLLAVFLGIRMVGRPLAQLVDQARRVGRGELNCSVHLTSHDELAELAADFNAMCKSLSESRTKLHDETAAKITALEQLRHADRLKTVGRLASGIAHELGTPLNVVAGRAGLISSGRLTAEQIAESAVAIKAEADKMTRIIRQLLDFARASSPRKTPVDLRTVIRQTVDMLDSIAEKHDVRLVYAQGADGPDPPQAVAEIDPSQMQQVLANLTINAIQAMPGGGEVRYILGRRPAQPPGGGNAKAADYYAIEVHDSGVGIPEENLPQLFEPFFTTKDVGVGTGLGLSIAHGIVQEHGGWIDVASRVGQGSCFTIYLPAGDKP